MEKFYSAIVVFIFLTACNQKEKSFDRLYLVEYGYSIRWLKEGVEGIPPLYITSFLKIGADGTVINGNRRGKNDSIFVFREQGLPSQIFDSLSLVTKSFNKDTTLGTNDFSSTFDGVLYAFIIERENERYLVDFDSESHQITPNLRNLTKYLLDMAHAEKGSEIAFTNFLEFQTDFKSILKKKSKRLPPPPIKITIKFLPPKADSTKH